MDSVAFSSTALTCIFGSSLLGLAIRSVLPAHHKSEDSRKVVILGMGLVATMTSLVLSLMLSSARSTYDMQSTEVNEVTARIVTLDRLLALYGPETKEFRGLYRASVFAAVDRMWSKDGEPAGAFRPAVNNEVLLSKLLSLSPKDERQRFLQAQALSSLMGIMQTRWLMYAQTGSSVPRPFMYALVFWLSLLFLSFGLYAQPNTTVLVSLLASALVVSSAIGMILEMSSPFSGLMAIPSGPTRAALAALGG
jgi:hypothetical protein